MSEPVNIVLEKYDNEELAEANELIGDLFINANIENKRLKAENDRLRAQLSAAEDEANASDTFMCGYLLGADQREIGGTDEQHTASMEELGWVRIGRLAQAKGEPSAAEAGDGTVPEAKYLMALDDARLARTDAERWKRIARDHQGLCKSLKATNEDLLQIIADLNADNAKQTTSMSADGEPPYERLIEVLRRDWDIDVSWDGLRKFWYVGLTEEGVRRRDAAAAGAGTNTGIEVEDA